MRDSEAANFAKTGDDLLDQNLHFLSFISALAG
jgi:hypothetical protein